MANGITSIPLADAYDLAAFLEATGRTIPRHEWAAESIAAFQRRNLEALF